MRAIALCWTVMLLTAPALAGPDLFVAPDGDDAADGTKDAPLATVERTQQAVRKLQQSREGDAPIVVAIRGGRYELRAPITFGPEDSGTAGAPVIWRAYQDEKTVFSGGKRITGWEKTADGLWRAELPEVGGEPWRFRELFVDGQRRPRARHPNEGYLRVVEPFPDNRTGFTFEEGDIPAAVEPGELELVFLHDWSTSRVPVEKIERGPRKLHVEHRIGPKAGHYRITHFEPHPRYYLEAGRALLDAPGEWWLDREQGVVYYKPKDGEKVGEPRFMAPVAGALLRGTGTDSEPVEHLRFEGLTFRHCAWPLPEGGYAAGQASFHEQRDDGGGHGLRAMMPAAVHFERAAHITIRRCRIEQVGASGVWFGERCDRCALTTSVVRDTSGNGVMIGETRNRRVGGAPWWKAAPDQAATGNTVRNCRIRRPGAQFFGAVGVWAGITRGTTVEHNSIGQTPYTGVSLGWMWNPKPTPAGNNVVRRNNIHHVMQTLSDGGGIYTLGRQPGSRLAHNVIHGIPPNAGRAESNGMFLDQGTKGFTIERNLIFNVARSPLRFHQAHENLVRDNVLVVPPSVPKIRYNATEPERITKTDNTVIPAEEWNPAHYRDRIDAAGIDPDARKELPVNGAAGN